MLNGFGEANEIDALRAELAGSAGVRVRYHGADVSQAAEIEAMVQATQETLGSLDILVNNAGIQHVAPIDEFPAERWEAVIAVNLTAVFLAMRAAIPAMKQRGWGRIINTASAHGLVASPQKVAYVAAKHGVLGITKVAAIELANAGITVNAICPGWVLTPLVEKQLAVRAQQDGIDIEQAAEAFLAEKQPMREFTTPAQIGALACFLCSDVAKTITGAPLSIDGGWVAQ